MTPDDTKQLAEDVKKVMELEAKIAASSTPIEPHNSVYTTTLSEHQELLYQRDYSLMADIIRRYQQVVEMQREALEFYSETCHVTDDILQTNEKHWQTYCEESEPPFYVEMGDKATKALALTAPLVKEKE